jgi:excisionase family DNA binding protein
VVSSESPREDAAPAVPRKPFDRCYTVSEVASILGTGTTTVRRLLAQQAIAHQRVSARRTVVRESALRAYLDTVTVDVNDRE